MISLKNGEDSSALILSLFRRYTLDAKRNRVYADELELRPYSSFGSLETEVNELYDDLVETFNELLPNAKITCCRTNDTKLLAIQAVKGQIPARAKVINDVDTAYV